MRWEFDNPDAAKQIARLEYDNRPIPDYLIAPELKDIEYFYWQAFIDLSGDRGASGFIPWSVINAYAKEKGFDNISAFERIIKTLDANRPKAEASK